MDEAVGHALASATYSRGDDDFAPPQTRGSIRGIVDPQERSLPDNVFSHLMITGADILIPSLKCFRLQFCSTPGNGVSDRQNYTGQFRDFQLDAPWDCSPNCQMHDAGHAEQLFTTVDSGSAYTIGMEHPYVR